MQRPPGGCVLWTDLLAASGDGRSRKHRSARRVSGGGRLLDGDAKFWLDSTYEAWCTDRDEGLRTLMIAGAGEAGRPAQRTRPAPI